MSTLSDLYRPQRFSQLVEQTGEIRSLQAKIASGAPGRFLVSGPSGTGKTTLALIIARAYRCSAPVDGSPCTSCRSCTNFQSSGCFGFTTFSGSVSVASLEALMESSSFGVLTGGPHVIFFDEVHGFSKHAWFRLYSELEIPKNRIFIFATAFPEEVPGAIKDRLLHYELKPVSVSARVGYLRKVCNEQKIGFDEPGLNLLALLSEGSARKLLRNLDRVSLEGATERCVRTTFNLDRVAPYGHLLRSLLAHDLPGAFARVRDLETEPQTIAATLRTVLAQVYQGEILRQRQAGFALTGIADADQQNLAGMLRDKASALDLGVDQLVANLLLELEHSPAKSDHAWLVARFLRLNELLTTEATRENPIDKPAKRTAYKRVSRLSASPSTSAARYLDKKKVRSLFDAASYLTQVHGKLFNGSVLFLHDRLHLNQREGADLVSDFLHELGMRVAYWSGGNEQLHYIYQHQLSARAGFNTLVSIAVPSDFILPARDWFEENFMQRISAKSEKSAVRSRWWKSDDQKRLLDAHWRCVRLMCRNVCPEISVQLEGRAVALLDLLKIGSKLREALGDISLPHPVRMSGSISAATRRATFPGWVSAFGDERWDELVSGWEVVEHTDRKQFVSDIEDERKLIDASFVEAGELTNRLRERELAKLQVQLTGDPRLRKRGSNSWIGRG